MKELLIFVLLIFFIEIKTENKETSSVPNEETISKPNKDPSKELPKKAYNCLKKYPFSKCPKNTKKYGVKCCIEPPVKCISGKISGGKCKCPARSKLINGQCIKISI